jgi:hypothetical protein
LDKMKLGMNRISIIAIIIMMIPSAGGVRFGI